MAQDQKYILDNSKLVEYDNTINVLASDHFQDHPLKPSDKISKNISKLNSKSFKINDIIFLEVDQNRKVYTFGKNFSLGLIILLRKSKHSPLNLVSSNKQTIIK